MDLSEYNDLRVLLESQAKTIARLEKANMVRQKRIEGLLKRWEIATSMGLLPFYKKKVKRLQEQLVIAQKAKKYNRPYWDSIIPR